MEVLVSGLTHHEIERVGIGIDGAIQVVPQILNSDARLVDPIRIVSRFETRTNSLVELLRVAQDPVKDGGTVIGIGVTARVDRRDIEVFVIEYAHNTLGDMKAR